MWGVVESTLTTSECVAATALIPPPIPLPILPLHDGGRDLDTIPTGKPLPKALVVVGIESGVIAPPCSPQMQPTLSISCKLTLARKFVAHSTMCRGSTYDQRGPETRCAVPGWSDRSQPPPPVPRRTRSRFAQMQQGNPVPTRRDGTYPHGQ